MSLTRSQASSEIQDVIKAALDAVGYPIKWENVSNDSLPPSDGSSYARVFVRHTGGEVATLAGGNASQMFERFGNVTVQIFTPIGSGQFTANEADANHDPAQSVLDAIEGQTTAGGVRFRRSSINEIGTSQQWYQTNVVTEFEYEQRK